MKKSTYFIPRKTRFSLIILVFSAESMVHDLKNHGTTTTCSMGQMSIFFETGILKSSITLNKLKLSLFFSQGSDFEMDFEQIFFNKLQAQWEQKTKFRSVVQRFPLYIYHYFARLPYTPVSSKDNLFKGAKHSVSWYPLFL